MTPWFPPPGLTVALLVVGGLRFLPAVAVAELLSALLVFDVLERFDLLQLGVNTVAVAGAYAVGPALLRAATPFSPRLRRLRDVLLMLALGVTLGPLLAAALGSGVLVWAGTIPASAYFESVRTWFVGDALGAVTVAPALTMLLATGRLVPRGTRVGERVVQASALVGVPVATMLLDGEGGPELAYLSLVPMVWVAVRYGIRGAVGAVALQNVCVTIVAGSDLGAVPELVTLQGLMTLIAATGLVLGAIVSESRRTERELAHRERHDPLTGLVNRDELVNHLGRLPANGTPGPALALVDLDRFARINELHGTGHGDEVLTLAAKSLCAAMGDGCVCARFGGDEFAVVDPGCADREAAEALGARVARAVSDAYAVGPANVPLSASVGVALGEPGDSTSDLVRGANIALHAAKLGDRGSVVLFDTALGEPFRRRHRLELDLPHALEREAVELVYQPIVPRTSGPRACEALLRWQHPIHGAVPAALLVDVAEEAGLMGRVDLWVARQVCRRLAAWRAAGDPRIVSVNVSAAALLCDDYASALLHELRAHGLPTAGSVWVEVTEELLIDDLDRAAAGLTRLRDAGVCVLVDDFGTGYSSLTYLERLPLDGVKLDRTLIERLGQQPRARALLAGVIQMAHALGLRVVAEGIETETQRDALTELGCDFLQGFLLGLPARED